MRKSTFNFKIVQGWFDDEFDEIEPKKESWKPEKPSPRRIKSATGRQQRVPTTYKNKWDKKTSFRDDAQIPALAQPLKTSGGVNLPLIDTKPFDDRVRKPRYIWQTLSLTDKLTTEPPFHKDDGRGDSQPPSSLRPFKKTSPQLEDNLTLGDLKSLEQIFKHYKLNGKPYIEIEEFVDALKTVLAKELQVQEEMEEFFKNLDVFHRNQISWSNLVMYLHKKFNIKEHRDSLQLGIFGFQLPPTVARLGVHSRKGITSMVQHGENGLLMMGEDGFLSFWCLDELELQKVQNVWPKCLRKNKIFDMTLLSEEEKLIISTDLMSLRFFEAKVFNFIFELNCLESMPLVLDSCVLRNKSTVILYGDEIGAINVLIFPVLTAIMPKIRGFTDSPHQIVKLSSLISQGLLSFYRWKVHNEFINELRFVPSLHAVISCCSESKTALVVGSIDGRQRTGTHHIPLESVAFTHGQWKLEEKEHNLPNRFSDDEYILETPQGVRSFDYSDQAKVIAAGGLDRMIRIWSPNCKTHPLHILTGHMKCICLVRFHEKKQRLLISISRDKEIRIWDSKIFNQLYVLHGYNYLDTLQSASYFYFAGAAEKLVIVIDAIYVLSLQKLRRKSYKDTEKGHSGKVTACILSFSKMMLTTGCTKGRLMVWNVQTGMYLNDLQDLDREPLAVQCLCMDHTDSRVLSGHAQGFVKVWNLNNFHLLKIFRTETNGSICAIACGQCGMYRWTVAAGSGRAIHFFGDVETKAGDFQPQMYTLIDFKNSLIEFDEAIHKTHQPSIRKSRSFEAPLEAQNHKSKPICFKPTCQKKVHILCISIGPWNRLATGNDNGEIHIWNLITRILVSKMVSSFHLENRTEGICLRECDLQIWRLEFLMSRAAQFQFPGAQLVSIGPYEAINFWSLCSYSKKPFAQFVATDNNSSVNAMHTCDGDRQMVTADNNGFVWVWDISNYAMKMPETEMPPLVYSWHAHIDAITDLAVVENEKLLITTSKDKTVRLWTLCGELIGLFGQTKPWNLYFKQSWCHPHIPADILSLPLQIAPDSPLQNIETVQGFLWSERKAMYSFLSAQMKKSAHLDDSLEMTSALSPSALFAPSLVRQRKQTVSRYIEGNLYLGCFHTLYCSEIKSLGLKPLPGYQRIFKTTDSKIQIENETEIDNQFNIIHCLTRKKNRNYKHLSSE